MCRKVDKKSYYAWYFQCVVNKYDMSRMDDFLTSSDPTDLCKESMKIKIIFNLILISVNAFLPKHQ